LKLTFSRPLYRSHKQRALECHLKNLREVEVRALEDLIGKEEIEQAEAGHCRPSSGFTKRKAGTCKGIQQPPASRRCIGMSSTDNDSIEPCSDHPPSQPRPAFESDQFVTAVGDKLEDISFFDSLPEPWPTPEPLLPAVVTEFSAGTHNIATPNMGLQSEFCYPCHDFQQPMFTCESWPTSASLRDDTFLPMMAGEFDALPPLQPEQYSVDPRSLVQLENIGPTEASSNVRCNKKLSSTADRLARLSPHSNTLFPSS
jgi:hypothetical protein